MLCFFFSSKRRHTRLRRDWSSDVCSSDLKLIKFKKSWYLRDNVNLKDHTPDVEKLKFFENKFSIPLRKIIIGDRFFYKYNEYHKFTDKEIFSIIQQELEFYDKVLDEIKPDHVLLRTPDYQYIQLFY